jgi:hypothetical protein
MSWVFEHSRSKKNARLVLLAIADHAHDDGGGAYPSMPKLRHKTGLGERAVTDLVASLERLGELKVWRNAGPNGCNLYRVLMTPAESAPPQNLHPAGNAGVQEMQGAGDAPPQETTATPADPAPVTVLEPSKISPTERSDKRRGSKTPEPDRPDVEQICTRLADRIEANGSKRPTITAQWRTEARLMLDVDGRELEKVIRAIDWCQADPFWHTNILSMPALRKQYDKLRLAAKRTRASPGNGLVEHNGMQLKPETAARLADRSRFEAEDRKRAQANQTAIGGSQ